MQTYVFCVTQNSFERPNIAPTTKALPRKPQTAEISRNLLPLPARCPVLSAWYKYTIDRVNLQTKEPVYSRSLPTEPTVEESIHGSAILD